MRRRRACAQGREHGARLEVLDDADLAISALTVREIAKGVAKLRKTKPETAARLT